ncbi:hypothetical protein ACO2Q3_13395 [Caulobacter sp. KR2-114]|uniref:hypothetical protein n=1 Tax=Caulobacter sp. KR2-114 TaxID=3400912 RepID=UPI003C1217ED
MSDELTRWAIAERDFIRAEIKWFKAGAKLFSPSRDDITSTKLTELETRLEQVQLALKE